MVAWWIEARPGPPVSPAAPSQSPANRFPAGKMGKNLPRRYFVTITLRESQLFCLPTWHLLHCPVTCLSSKLIPIGYFLHMLWDWLSADAFLGWPSLGYFIYFSLTKCTISIQCAESAWRDCYTPVCFGIEFLDCMAYILLDVGLHIASFPFYPIDACFHNSFLSFYQCSRSDGPVINWPPGSGSLILNYGS